MDYFWGSVKLMFIIYGIAAIISFGVAWIMQLLIAAIQRKKAAPEASAGAPVSSPIPPANAALERKA
jgi:hypothetical protein